MGRRVFACSRAIPPSLLLRRPSVALVAPLPRAFFFARLAVHRTRTCPRRGWLHTILKSSSDAQAACECAWLCHSFFVWSCSHLSHHHIVITNLSPPSLQHNPHSTAAAMSRDMKDWGDYEDDEELPQAVEVRFVV